MTTKPTIIISSLLTGVLTAGISLVVSTSVTEAHAEVIPEAQPVLAPLKSEQVNYVNSDKDSVVNIEVGEAPSAKPKPKPKPKKKAEAKPSASTQADTPTAKKKPSAEAGEGYDHTQFNTEGLTPEQVSWIREAAKLSKQKIPAAFFRAVGEQESNIRPDAYADDRNGGTYSIWQINEALTRIHYDGGDFTTDRNNNGTPDVQEPMIAAKIAASHFDALYLQVKQMREDYPDEQWVKDMTLLESVAIAHNAGPTGMRKYPNFRTPQVTDKYLKNMKEKIPAYAVVK